MIADAIGRAVAFIIAPGQAHELPHAVALLDRLPDVPKWVVADRGYSSHAFREHIRALGAMPAIPPKRNEAPVARLRLDLCPPQPGRAAMGQAQGVAGRRHPLRKDRHVLHGRSMPRRIHGLDQALTGPTITVAFSA